MNSNLLNTIIGEGSALLRFLIATRTPSPKIKPLESESPEEAFKRIYQKELDKDGGKDSNIDELKLEAARRAIAEVENELNRTQAEVKTKIETEPKPEPETKQTKSKPIAVACLPCGLHHIVTTSAALSEAVRFARSDGIESPEVIKRLEIASEETDIAERIDFAPSNVEKSPPKEKEFLRVFVPKLRALRHQTDTITHVQDLEKAAAIAQELATEYRTKVRELKWNG